jgi:DNA-binding NarL/FixJ family response regulator
VDAIYQVLQGQTYVTPEMAKHLPVVNLNTAKAPGELTAREREVLQLVAEGKSAKEIAAILSISPKPVTFHKTNLMEKLGVHNTAGLTRHAMRRGLAE